MSDGAKQPQHGASPPPACASLPHVRAVSAARATPASNAPPPPLGKRLRSEASNLTLNLLSILRDAVEDFRRRDRYFKYKALIVGGWFALSATSLGIACPESAVEVGDFDARVVLNQTPGRPSLVIHNEGDEPWLNVIFIVNGEWRASVARVDAKSYTTLTPKQLLGPGGVAPADLPLRDLEMRTDDGSAVLLREGHPL